MTKRRVNTEYARDPIFVEHEKDYNHIILRIGEERPGETRYANLTPDQATEIASNLLRTAISKRERPETRGGDCVCGIPVRDAGERCAELDCPYK